jgi:hypothetical protein
MTKKYQTFQAFYPYYLTEHSHLICRRLPFIGSFGVVLASLYIVLSTAWGLICLLPFIGYGCAWTGHYCFEKNRPATFTYPLYSLIGDWVMFKDMLAGKIRF